MRKTSTKLSRVTVNGRRLYCVTWPKVGAGRNRQHFKEKPEAETFLQKKIIEQQNYGTAGMSFTEQQRSEYLDCYDKLRKHSPTATLVDAVAFYLPHLQATNRSCTVVELVTELLSLKKKTGASARYLGDLRSRLGQFSGTFDQRLVSEITSTDIDQWLCSLADHEGNQLAPVTRNNFLRVLGVAFNFAVKRKYAVTNPASQCEEAHEIEGTVGILTVAQTARLIERAPAELVPFLAIGAFAGLRRAELERLDWSEIDFESGLILVTAKKAKSARKRFVRIRPNLAAWLRPLVNTAGPVTPSSFNALLNAAREAAGIDEWPQNALRHGFASYVLAHENDAAKLALELGHTNANLVFNHYRELVKPKEAARYWNIQPETAENVIAMTA